MPNTGSGRLGEQLTAESLNVRSVSGDTALDALSVKSLKCTSVSGEQNDRYLAFVEVKTRSADGLSHPFEAITSSKRAKVIKTAQYYLINHETNLQPRFDVAEVTYKTRKDGSTGYSLNYIKNAF